MVSEPRSGFSSSLLGLVLIALLALAAVVGFALQTGGQAPAWIFNLYLVVGVGILAIYVALVYLPQRRLERMYGEQGRATAQLESTFSQALEELQAGDLAASRQLANLLSPRIASSLAAAGGALEGLVEQIQRSSIEVAVAGETVHSTAGELAAGSSEQAAAVVEITASMEELARTAAQIASNAASQAELAAAAESAGNAGADAVAEALGGVEEVKQRIASIASRADALGTQSREIYKVLDLINEISQETHILSLNAAIEAAAAGEHGARFAVVAEEVRRLAQRSRESVGSVHELLDEFARSIRATVVASEEGDKEVDRVLERARAAASAIDELRGALTDTARAAREISLATQQQRGASDQVVLTLKEVSQVIQRMAEGLKHFSGTADRLNHLALSIQLLTQSFTLDSPHSLRHQVAGWAGEMTRRAGHWEALGAQLQALLAAHPFLEMSYAVDADGNMLAFAVAAVEDGEREIPDIVAIGANMADRPWFQGVRREGRITVTPLYESLLTGERCFTVAAPLMSDNGTLVAVLGCDVNAISWTKI